MNEAAEMTPGTALAIPDRANLAAMFRKDGGLDPIIAKLESAVKAHVPDVTTKKGRDAIKSLAYNVSRSKTALDDAGKQLNEEARSQIAVVDAARRKIRERLDALRDEARKPLDDWEATEERRVQTLKDRLAALDAGSADAMSPVEVIRAVLAEIAAVEIGDDWQEYKAEAEIAKGRAVRELTATLASAEQREADADELSRLRAEAEARAEEDRKRKDAEEAEVRRIEAEKAEADRMARIEQDKKDAADRAARAAEDRAKAEAERVKREYEERAEAERRAAAEREAEYKRNIAAEAAKAEAAAKAERDRIAAEQRAEAEARSRREQDVAHRQKIKGDIADALRTMAGASSPEQIAEALILGKIPHTKVSM